MGEIGIAPTQMGEIRFNSWAARLLFLFIMIYFLFFNVWTAQSPEENAATIACNQDYNSLKAWKEPRCFVKDGTRSLHH